MPRPIYLLSDLHLPAGPSPLRVAFRDFLAGPARAAQAVYILGDLFDYWIGDDAGLEVYAEEVAALSELHQSGVESGFQHGNRDFLVGRKFAEAAEIVLLPETFELELAGEQVLLAHGDQFCTRDLAYQRWRRFARRPSIQSVYLALPKWLRERLAGGVRSRSSLQKSSNSMGIMDVSDDAIIAAFEAASVDRIIHGHTHRPQDHACTVGGRARTRTVLADWTPGRYEVLRADASGFTRIRLSASSSA